MNLQKRFSSRVPTYYEQNRDRLLKYQLEYYKNNYKRIREYQTEYCKLYKKTKKKIVNIPKPINIKPTIECIIVRFDAF